MNRKIKGFFWIGVYLLITLGPLFILLIGPRPVGREFWRDLSVGLGFCGLSMMGLQFVLTARFKEMKAPYGIDIVYFFHRQISYVILILIISHPVLLFIFEPKNLELLNPITAPWAARLGVTAIVVTILLVAFSVWRKKFRLEYDQWRIWHGVMAIAVIAFAMVHVEMRGYYLNTLWKQIFWGLFGVLWVVVLVWIRVIKPLLLIRKPYKVVSVIEERGNAWTMVLRPDGHSGLRFKPGQFAWLSVWDSPIKDHEHPFSISSSAENDTTLAFTIKELGDFTSTIKNLEPEHTVYVDGPYGSFSVDRHPSAREYVFIAGGVGITPIMSTLRTLADRGDGRPLTLLYANKDLDSMIFYEEIETLKTRLQLKVIPVLEKPLKNWTGERGYLNAEILSKYIPDERVKDRFEVFICGPSPMMDAVEDALTKIGVPAGDFHSERFDFV